jgi:hypothetical protein
MAYRWLIDGLECWRSWRLAHVDVKVVAREVRVVMAV